MRPNASSLVLVLGSFSVAQAGVYDRDGRLDRRQNAAPSSAVNVASGLMGVVNRVLASATVTETVRQTITVGGDGAAGAVGNATVTVTVAETTITVTAGQAGGEASATLPGGALGAIGGGGAAGESSGAGAPASRPPVAATGGVGVTVIEVPQEAIKTSKVGAAAPASTTAAAVTSGPAGASSTSGAAGDAASSVASTEAGAPASSTDAGASASATDAASSADAASSTLQAPPGLSTDAGSASSLQPLPGLESSSLAVLPILESSTAAVSTTAAEAVSSTSVPAAAASTTAAASSATSLAQLPGIASSLDSTLNLGGAGGAALPTSLPVPDGAFGGVAGAIPIASAEVQPPPLPTVTPGVANGADAGTPPGGVQIDVSGLTLSRQLNLGNLVQARQTGIPAAAGVSI